MEKKLKQKQVQLTRKGPCDGRFYIFGTLVLFVLKDEKSVRGNHLLARNFA